MALQSNARDKLLSFTEEELFTACLWAEARGEPEQGQAAVAGVILNRVGRGMAKGIRDVIMAPKQFSWTDPRDINFAKVLQAPQSDPGGWKRAKRIAQSAMKPDFHDASLGADHYLNIELTRMLRGGTLPKWAIKGIHSGKITVVIGKHTFLNLLG